MNDAIKLALEKLIHAIKLKDSPEADHMEDKEKSEKERLEADRAPKVEDGEEPKPFEGSESPKEESSEHSDIVNALMGKKSAISGSVMPLRAKGEQMMKDKFKK